jgi:hypothetical protein
MVVVREVWLASYGCVISKILKLSTDLNLMSTQLDSIKTEFKPEPEKPKKEVTRFTFIEVD